MTVRNPDPGADVPETPGDERQQLLRHRSGDPRAFARLVAEYRAPVYSYLFRCGVPDADRDDLFQDVFVKIHAAAARYRDDLPLHPWLFTIVANTVRTYHRRRKVRALVFADPPSHDPPAAAADGERQAMARQTAAWLEVEIRKLPLAQREVLLLTSVEKLPQKDVAGILGLPVNTVKTHLRRARQALAQKLARHHAFKRGEEKS